jgi:nucleotide-binding universal stress UspA family protein
MAKKINNILVPVDGSQNALRGLDRAIDIAKGANSTITALYVFQLPWKAGLKFTKSMEKQAQVKATRAIGVAKQKVEKQGVSFNWKTTGGKPGDAILNVSKGTKADMIVIGARGLGAAKEKFFGSTSNFVMHKSNKPVLVVK